MNQPYCGITMKFNTVRVYPRYKHFIFVEGSSDKRFYGLTNNRELSEKACYLYADFTDEEKGKEAVSRAYKEICRDSNLSKKKKKCIFIVDRDWDEKPGSPFRVTLGHSMENYFLTTENLKIIFEDIGQEGFEEFSILFNKFAKDTVSFWALKATVVYAWKNRFIFHYQRVNDFDTIFRFSYSEKETSKGIRPKIKYSTKAMNEEVDAMKVGISMSYELKAYYERQVESIINNPLLVRGHDAFHFLQCYLKGKYDVELEFYGNDRAFLEKCVPRFSVKLDM